MKTTSAYQNIDNIKLKSHSFYTELGWLSQVIEKRLKQTLGANVLDVPPDLEFEDQYAEFIKKQNPNIEERLVLILALVPHIRPDFFDNIIQKNLSKAGDFPQLGGVRGKNFRGFIPTGETALYLLAGDDLIKRFEVQRMFAQDQLFAQHQVLWLEDPPVGEPAMSGKMVMAQEYVELFTLGEVSPPRFGINFPAQRVETQMEWDDLVLPNDTKEQISDLEIWLKYGDTLLKDWNMSKKIKPGYRVLFHGPPGTGKTLTASLLGKYTNRDVYKIDLSLVVSKFIGETEKNLASLFDKAENKGWILFFDEADALFGKRTNVRDAHDKYANQEVSFLLQRTESYSGLVILATNFKSNIDEAFSRRFQSHIYFPPPKYSERLALWKKSLPDQTKLQKEIDLTAIAKQYELTGANIINIVQYACLKALENKGKTIQKNDLIDGIKKEYSKDGKVA